MPTFDPVASFEITAVEASLYGRLLRIPALPASQWLVQLMRTSDALSLMSILEDDPTDDLFADGVATANDVRTSLEEMLEVAAGCLSWTAFCLASVAREHWQYVGGELVRCNVALAQIPLGAALVAIYTTVARRLDDKALKRFDLWLDTREVTVRQMRRPDLPPLPATALQYVQKRPKTVLRRPQDPQADSSGEPMPPPALPADSARVEDDGHKLPDGAGAVGVVSPPVG